MSDPVTNVEIEDVLSSIRRLVSQDGRARPAVLSNAEPEPDPSPAPEVASGEGHEAAPAAAPEEESAVALVLTQDHRVDDVTPATEATGVRVEDARREAATAVRSELERAIEELEAAMGIADRDTPATTYVAPAEPNPVAEAPAAEAEESAAVDLDEEIDWEAPVGRAMEGAPPSFEDSAEEFDPDHVPEEASFAEPAEDVPEAEALTEDREEGWPEDSDETAETAETAPDSGEAGEAVSQEAPDEAHEGIAADALADEAPEFFEYAPAAPQEASEEAVSEGDADEEHSSEERQADDVWSADDTEADVAEVADAADVPGSEDVGEDLPPVEAAELEDAAADQEDAPEQEAPEEIAPEEIALEEALAEAQYLSAPQDAPEGDSALDARAEVEAEDQAETASESDADGDTSAPFFARSTFERLHLVSGGESPADEAYSGQYEETYDDGLNEDPIPAQVEATLEDQGDYFEAPEGPFDSSKDDPFPAAEIGEGADQVVALDEEQLRDMVAEIVREELQGELGERITRNVRKLVRREINRALAGQDLI